MFWKLLSVAIIASLLMCTCACGSIFTGLSRPALFADALLVVWAIAAMQALMSIEDYTAWCTALGRANRVAASLLVCVFIKWEICIAWTDESYSARGLRGLEDCFFISLGVACYLVVYGAANMRDEARFVKPNERVKDRLKPAI